MAAARWRAKLSACEVDARAAFAAFLRLPPTSSVGGASFVDPNLTRSARGKSMGFVLLLPLARLLS